MYTWLSFTETNGALAPFSTFLIVAKIFACGAVISTVEPEYIAY